MTVQLLSVIHHPIFGGPHNQALRLADPLEKRGIRTLVVLPDEEGNAYDRLEAGGIDLVSIRLNRLRASRDPRLLLQSGIRFRHEVGILRTLMRRHHVRVVQLNSLVNVQAAVAAQLEGVAIVWQLLDTRSPPALRRLMMPYIVRVADVLMTTGIRVAEQHPGALDLGDRLVPFIPPVDTRRFVPSRDRRQDARRRLGVADETVLVGTVGNLNPQKGHEDLLTAVAALKSAGRHATVRILGARTPTQESYARMLEDRIRDSGLTSDFPVLVDPGGGVEQWLPAFDVFCLAARPLSEGIPTAMLEAMACGVPAVVTDVGGVGEILYDDSIGFLVPTDDSQALVGALDRMMDPSVRATLGRTARSRALDQFDVERCAAVHEHAYRLALSRIN